MFDTDVATLLGPPLSPRPPHDPASEHRPGLVATGRTGDDGKTHPGLDEEASPTHRRDLLTAGALLAAASATGSPAERAAQLEHGVYELAARFEVTPLGELVAPVERAWGDAETLLGACLSGGARRDLESVTGWYSFYRGRLASHTGEQHTALTFLVLAGQHADAAGDTLLAGSAAAERSALAFFAGQFTTSAKIARQALPGAHAYVRPVLASQVARASAQDGDTDSALAALRTMRVSVWTGGPQPGAGAGDEKIYEAFSAATLSYLGQDEDAERHARRSLTLLTESGCHLQLAGTHLALARAFLHRSEPDPEQAAAALKNALTAAEGNGHGRTVTRAAGIYRELAAGPDWARLPTVRELGDRLPSRRALPPATSL